MSSMQLLDLNSSTVAENAFCPQASRSGLFFLNLSSFILEGIVQMVICLLGIIGNIVSIFLLSRPELRSFFNQLLGILASFDLVYLITIFIESIRMLGYQTNVHVLLFPYFLYPVSFIAMSCSTFSTISVALERYIAVYYPLHYNRILMDATSHRGRLLTYFVPIICLGIIINIPKFLESQVIFKENGSPQIGVTDLRTNHLYITYYHNFFRILFIGVIPFLSIVFLNISIYLSLKRRRKGKRRNLEHLSLVLIMIVSTFVICHFPSLILNMHEMFVIDKIKLCKQTTLGGFPVWIIFSGFVSDILLVINSSANLFIYFIIGPEFRKQFHRYILCKKNGEESVCKCLQSSEIQPCRICGKVRRRMELSKENASVGNSRQDLNTNQMAGKC